MEITIDSHALFWFLTENPKLSRKAKRLIEESGRVIVPSIAIMEILYLLEKNNLAFKFIDFLHELKVRNYIVYPLDVTIIAQTISIDPKLEMHDRIIIATAQITKTFLVSRDSEIKAYYRNTIW